LGGKDIIKKTKKKKKKKKKEGLSLSLSLSIYRVPYGTKAV